MGWPYEFLDLSHEEKQQRRLSLDWYAAVAQYSAFAPAVAFLLVRLVRRVRRLRAGPAADYTQLPRSPVVKAHRLSAPGGVAVAWRRFVWWMGDDVRFAGRHWGQRDQWLLGLAWTAWLLTLCVLGTGRDYLHFTKRLGIVAVSQLPIQYLTALKSINPLAWVFCSSHEQVNRYHRVLGRIIELLIVLHIIFYNIFLFSVGVWLQRFFAPMVFCGVLASLGFHALTGTALARVRAYSYRLFFVVHLATALVVPPLIFFHAPPTRLYLYEALGLFLVDLGVRKFTSTTAPTKIETIPGTSLLKISATLPPSKASQFQAQPGSHVYLSVPPAGRTSTSPASKSPLFDFIFNPFTVASVNEESGAITLIARTRGGPLTSHLAHFASLPAPSSGPAEVPLAIEGPYGAAGKNFHDLLSSGADRILLVAGGVGATFALPIYHAIQQEAPSVKVQLIWAIRGAGDATWAVSTNPAGKSVLDDEHVQLFLTGDMGVADDADNAAGGGVEMAPLSRDGRRQGARQHSSPRRPNLEKIVDDTFRQGLEEKIAVLVCGPEEMARELKTRVRPWVMKGRRVWWHDETFGW